MACWTASSLATLLLVVLVAPAARADEPSPADKTLAQSLFEQGRMLMESRSYAQACPRFADSERLDPGGGTVLNLALCYEKLGKLALAHSTYNEALSAAIAERRADREAFARERIAALGARLPRLTLRVDDATPGVEVRVDGTQVPPSAWGLPTPVDPGRHTIDASAAGRAPYEAILTLREGEVRELAVALAPEAPAGITTPLYGGNAPRSEPRRSAAFWVLGGLSLAALATSAVTGAVAWSAHQSFDQICNSDRHYCSDASGPGDASRARTMGWVSTIALGGGVAAGLAALALPLTEGTTAVAGPGRILLQTTW
jgi:tetratricopeptide (TPR) repeat protein